MEPRLRLLRDPKSGATKRALPHPLEPEGQMRRGRDRHQMVELRVKGSKAVSGVVHWIIVKVSAAFRVGAVVAASRRASEQS